MVKASICPSIAQPSFIASIIYHPSALSHLNTDVQLFLEKGNQF